MNKLFGKIGTFLKEVKLEITKVNWPTKKETLRYTLTVIIVSIIMAIFLGGIDLLFNLIMNKIVSWRL